MKKIQKMQINKTQFYFIPSYKLSLISSLVTSVYWANQLFNTKINKRQTTQSLGLSWAHLHANPTERAVREKSWPVTNKKEAHSIVFLTNLHFLILIFLLLILSPLVLPPPPLPTDP